jgi:hypothetical protein
VAAPAFLLSVAGPSCAADPIELDEGFGYEVRACGVEEGPVQILASEAGTMPSLWLELPDARLVLSRGEQGFVTGPCGEDPVSFDLTEGAAGKAFGDGEKLWLLGAKVWAWTAGSPSMSVVSGASDVPIGYVQGQGGVVWDSMTGEIVVLGADAGRRSVFGEPVAATEDWWGGLVLSPRAKVQTGASVLAVRDEQDVLRVVDTSGTSPTMLFSDVKGFALDPDGAWLITETSIVLLPGGATMPVPIEHLPDPQQVLGDYYKINNGVQTELLLDTRTWETLEPPTPLEQLDYLGGNRFLRLSPGASWDPETGGITENAAVGDEAVLWIPGRDVGVRAPERLGEVAVRVMPFDGGDTFTVTADAQLEVGLASGHVIYADRTDSPASTYVAIGGEEPVRLERAAETSSTQIDVDVLSDGDILLEVDDGDRSGLWRYGLP